MRLMFKPATPGWSVYDLVVTNSALQLTTRNATEQAETVQVIEYRVTYVRSTFTKIFSICLVFTMWALSVYLLVLSVDHVIVRPRPLVGDTVGFAVGMLFALPALRLLMAAPFGSYIDFLGFAWNMLLVGISVFIMMTGALRDHKHNADILKRQRDQPQMVVLNKLSDDVTEVIQGMVQSALMVQKSGPVHCITVVPSGRSDDSAAPLFGSTGKDQQQ